jgi:hypothetical protein
MPLYEYEDKETGDRHLVSTQTDKAVMDAAVKLGVYRRIFSFNAPPTFSAVNPEDPRAEPISSRSRYKSELSRLSDEHSSRHNGMDVNYQPVDIRNPLELGVSEQGIEAAARKARNEGRTSPSTTIHL